MVRSETSSQPDVASCQWVAIVDPMSTGRGLAPLLLERGFKCAAVFSTDTVEFFRRSFIPEHFDVVVSHKGDLSREPVAETIEQLRGALNGPVVAVIAGCELGVELADALSEAMELRTNGTAMSEARRHKYLMQEALRAAGLRAVAQTHSDNLEELVAWAHEHKKHWPFVMKPARSALSDGVTLCHNEEELRVAFEAVSGRDNLLGEKNCVMVLQEYLRGTEYIVDTISIDGEHHICHIWRYNKQRENGASFVLHSHELIEYEGEAQRRLREYVFKCLDALGVRNGPAHAEVMLCPGDEAEYDDGDDVESGEGDGAAPRERIGWPCLVEVGARCHGDKGPFVARDAIGLGQLEYTIDAFVDGSLFRERCGKAYELRHRVREVFFVSRMRGELTEDLPLERIRALPGVVAVQPLVKKGDVVRPTVDYHTCPLRVTIMHPSRDVINETEKRLREIEAEAFSDRPKSVSPVPQDLVA